MLVVIDITVEWIPNHLRSAPPMTLGNSERKPSVDAVEVKRLMAEGLGASQIAKRLKIGRASVYRVRRSTEPTFGSSGSGAHSRAAGRC